LRQPGQDGSSFVWPGQLPRRYFAFVPVNKLRAVRVKAKSKQMELFHVFAALRTRIQTETQAIHCPAQNAAFGHVWQTFIMA